MYYQMNKKIIFILHFLFLRFQLIWALKACFSAWNCALECEKYCACNCSAKSYHVKRNK